MAKAATYKVYTGSVWEELTFTPSSHTHSQYLTSTSSVSEAYLAWGGKNFAGSYGPVDACLIPELGANRLAFTDAAAIIVEYSTNAGQTWTTYSTTDANKVNLFNGNSSSYYIGGSSAKNIDKTNYQVRFTINTSGEIYTVLNKFCILVSTNGSSGCWCTIDARLQSNYEAGTNTWKVFANKVTVSGWSGYNIINTSGITTYGNTKTSQYGQVRFTFGVTSHASTVTSNGLSIMKIMGFGGVGWTTPSTMAKTGQMYTYDYVKNVTFPAAVKATSFVENGTELSSKYAALANTIKALSISGKTITYTKGDGTTGTLTTQDTTYSVVTASQTGTNSGLVLASEKYVWNNKQDKLTAGSNITINNNTISATNTTYSKATSSALGLVKIGYSENGKNYPVELDSDGKMFVNVPWTDTDNNTTYSIATASKAGLVKPVSVITKPTLQSVTTTAGKYYQVQMSSDGNMFVNVPWTDTNTTYDLTKYLLLSGGTIDGNLEVTDTLDVDILNATTISEGGTALSSKYAAAGHSHAWSTITSKPTTISGYGITDCKIANGIITIGSNSITPLTSHQTMYYRPIQVNGTQILANTANTALNLKAGSNVSITNSSGTVTIAATDTTYSNATTSAAGLMSADDKKNLTYYVKGTQTASTNAWTGNLTQVSALYEGLTIRYRLPYAGTSTGATLNLTLSGGATGAIKVYRYGTSTQITTHFAANSVITMTYNGTNWIVDAFYDSNSYAYVRQYTTTTNADYPLLFAYETTLPSSYDTKYTRKNSNLTFNPSTGTLNIAGKAVATQEYVDGLMSNSGSDFIDLGTTIEDPASKDHSILDTITTSGMYKINYEGRTMWMEASYLSAETTGNYEIISQSIIDVFGNRKIDRTNMVGLIKTATTNNIWYTDATSSKAGVVKLGSDTTQNVTMNSVSSTTGRTYAIQKNSSGQLVVNVPWTDTNDNTTYAIATASTAGLVKPSAVITKPTINTRTTTAGRYYHVTMSSDGSMFVNVPWTDSGSSGGADLSAIGYSDLSDYNSPCYNYSIGDGEGNETSKALVYSMKEDADGECGFYYMPYEELGSDYPSPSYEIATKGDIDQNPSQFKLITRNSQALTSYSINASLGSYLNTYNELMIIVRFEASSAGTISISTSTNTSGNIASASVTSGTHYRQILLRKTDEGNVSCDVCGTFGWATTSSLYLLLGGSSTANTVTYVIHGRK